jgi:hypothetical protein
MPTKWRYMGDGVPYEGAADGGPGIDRGFRFTLEDKLTNRVATVNVEAVDGAGDRLSRMNAGRAVNDYTDEDNLPPRILMGRDGKCFLPGD